MVKLIIKEVQKNIVGKCKECCLLNKYCFTMLKEGKREKCSEREDGKNVVFKEEKK